MISLQSSQQVSSCGVEEVVAAEVKFIDERQSDPWTLHLCEGDGAVQGHDGCREELDQVVVERKDLVLVGHFDGGGVGMDRIDRRLQLIRPRVVAA